MVNKKTNEVFMSTNSLSTFVPTFNSLQSPSEVKEPEYYLLFDIDTLLSEIVVAPNTSDKKFEATKEWNSQTNADDWDVAAGTDAINNQFRNQILKQTRNQSRGQFVIDNINN